MLYTQIIHPVYSFASPELGYYKFGVSRLGGARHTFQVTLCDASAVYQLTWEYNIAPRIICRNYGGLFFCHVATFAFTASTKLGNTFARSTRLSISLS